VFFPREGESDQLSLSTDTEDKETRNITSLCYAKNLQE
jgi:hypothetical protein